MPRRARPMRTVLVVGAVLALALFAAWLPGRANAQVPNVACPPFTDITVTQQAAGSGSLTVQMQPPVPPAQASAPDSQSLRLYYFIDRVAAIYPPAGEAEQLIGGDPIPDGSAQIVQRVTHGDTETIDVELPPGVHSVAAVLAMGDVTCHETRPQPDPCSYVCGPPRTLLIGSAEVDIGPPASTSNHPPAGQAAGSPAKGLMVAVLLAGVITALALGGVALRSYADDR